MTNILSDKALAYLKEEHFAVLSTVNKDGSPQIATMWYLVDEDGTIVMNSIAHLQKVKNIRRDPRIAFCVQEGQRYVSLSGTIELIEDQEVVRRDILRLTKRYIKDDETREQYVASFLKQSRVALYLRAKKGNEAYL
ncbi:PPOX class F420-dependent oxidoreductase [Ktedonosporobacter rubrisoli]|uniref:PPOX class F420-dependent oxidoreductase n=1 Tax=Ktedonosporobacter rubrisoli TaxID=2509675 RepID=A0A4V0YYC8_KTERU|nr:PPOX class F420-dependent oxidoreductase [Ktedonosporobacter rubrisoli]QBD75771.1 PPOX class F420-dependent oxidoreductase [Ktedonosporobacter rubrisoli]